MAKNKKYLGSNYNPPSGQNVALGPNFSQSNVALPKNTVSVPNGATFDVDFTSINSLDSRFTFSRSTTATFINSSGYVQYANHNLFTNTAWLGSTLPTNWNLLIGTGTITWNANGSVTMTAATSQRPAINHSTITTINPGVPHTFGYLATGVSGSPTISQIINSSIAGETYAINGVTVASSTVVQSNDVVSCTFTPTSTNVTPRIGPGSSGAISGTSVTASRPQFNVGSSLQPYAANTSTAATYQAPRFDYSPTTKAARGLLFGGSATNLLVRSEDMATAIFPGWGAQTNLNTTGWTAQSSPDGASTAVKLIPTTTNATHYLGTGTISGITSGVKYTISVFVKASGYSVFGIAATNSQSRASFNLSTLSSSSYGIANTRTITPYPNGWYRVSMTWTTSATSFDVWLFAQNTEQDPVTSWSGDNTNSVTVWGAQLELGVEASSYIPTGTSTVQRTRDEMTMANISALNFNPKGGTVLMQLEDTPRDLETFPYFASFEQSTSGRGWAFARFNNSASAGRRVFGIAFKTGNSTLISSSGATRASGQYKFAATLDASVARMAVVVNGGAAVVDSATAATLTTIGSLKFNNTTESAPTDFASVWVAKLTYWPSVFPNTILVEMTK